MKIPVHLLLFMLLFTSLSRAQNEVKTCVLKGLVLDPDFQAVSLVKVTDELRGEKVLIPISNDGTFVYQLKAAH